MADLPRTSGGPDRIVRAAWIATAALVLTSATAAVAPEVLGPVHAVLSLAMFAFGTGALLWGYARGISRSRSELVTLSGLFLLSGDVAPHQIRTSLRVAAAVQTVAVTAAAAARPYSEVAFGILAPMLVLGLMAAWAGRHGAFPERPLKR
ncbi:MAG: hypothetical protein ACOYXM_18995 [Actinomycetota bacterium]